MWKLADWINKQPRRRRIYHWIVIALAVIAIVQNSIKLWHTTPEAVRIFTGRPK